jgi:predicted phage terminase large subunit-like protein
MENSSLQAALDRERAALRQVLVTREARNKTLAFTQYTFPKYRSNWHHIYTCSRLDALLRGEIKRLMLFMPPRNGKTELVSRRLPGMAFGLNPDEQIIAASYGSDLASKNNRDVQRIVDSEAYRKVFNGVRLSGEDGTSKKWARNSELFEIVDRAGYYKSSGVGGAITGSGFTLGIIDDPFKNREEADSQTIRDKVFNWYTSTFYTRAEENARILLTLTRWHVDDLAGRLIKQMKDDPKADKWEVVAFPAIRGPEPCLYDPREPGAALWPDKYPLDVLEVMKSVMGSRDWASLMQQTPIVDGGNIIKSAWWKFYKERPAKFDEVIQSWDLTFKEQGSSYVCGQVWGRVGASKYLLDLFRRQVGFVETKMAIETMAAKWPMAYRILIEDKANGPAVIESLKSRIPGIIAINPEGSKESRVHACSAQIEAGNVWLPEGAPWLHDYLEEWAQFPNGSNDDQVDASTQALLKLNLSSIERLERLLKM